MAIYNTPSDAANKAVRAYLTSVGEHYLGKSFNTGSGSGKATWEEIKSEFANSCAYCGQIGAVQIEHLIMFNRSEYVLHHPGNIVLVCKPCNERNKDESKKYVSWQEQLIQRCGGKTARAYIERISKIESHISRHK